MDKIYKSIKVGEYVYGFVEIGPGIFSMGSNHGLPIEMPVHNVTINSTLNVLETPVTQQMYVDIMEENPSHYINPESPVESISWYDAVRFCEKLSSKTDRQFRLPTENEWEYICRAGSETEYFIGNDERQARMYAWYDINSKDTTNPVKQKLPNQWGLYDVIGNVWEWCSDNYRATYLEGETETKKKVIRGGAYDMDIFRLRSAYRSSEFPELGLRKIGFRIVTSNV